MGGAVNTKYCETCGKTIPHNRRGALWEKAKYCSTKCAAAARSKASLETAATIPLRTCEQCGNPIPYNRRYGLGEYAKRIYCSVSCASKVGGRRPKSRQVNVNASFDATIREYLDDTATAMEIAQIAVTDNPLKCLPPETKRLWCPVRHTYYTAIVEVLR